MKIQNFTNFINENKDLSEINKIFNQKQTYKKRVKSDLIDIIMQERKISEKSFGLIDSVMEEVDNFFESNSELDIIDEFKTNKFRTRYCAEKIYADSFLKKES